MPLETASLISQLVPTNPVHTDGLAQADSHMRLIKSVLQAQFPNWTAVALTSTQAAIDAAVTAVGTNGVPILADAGAFFKTNTTDGFTNPTAGEVDVKAAASVVAKFKSDLSTTLTGALTVAGALAATGPITGPGALPIGGTLVWWSDTLPTGYGTFAWVNGGTYLRSNLALWNAFGTTYGIGDNVTTANLPDLRDAVPVGKGTMGGTSAIGRITQFTTSVLGNFFGACLHVLGITEIPAHTHAIADHHHDLKAGTQSGTGAGSTFPTGFDPADSVAFGKTNDASLAPAVMGGGLGHDNVQPSLVCNWIIRTA